MSNDDPLYTSYVSVVTWSLIFYKQDPYFLHAAYQVLLNKMSPNKTVVDISARKLSQFVCATNENKVVTL